MFFLIETLIFHSFALLFLDSFNKCREIKLKWWILLNNMVTLLSC